jgi:hypothetical protein
MMMFVASGDTMVTPILHGSANATVVLSSCEAVDGPFCDDMTGELVSCDMALNTVREFCPFGCNSEQLRCNSCTPNTTECSADVVRVCDENGVITSESNCSTSNQVCFMGACVDCNPGTVECRINTDMTGTIVTCDMDGNIVDSLLCPYACDSKAAACFDCFAGMTHCIGPDLVDCALDGTITSQTSCLYGCNTSTSACNACTPDPGFADPMMRSPECQGDDLVQCDGGGSVVSTTPCTAFGCNTTVDPDACNTCDPDPSILAQCIDADTLVTCSTGGQIVTTTECAPSVCDAALGQCGTCTPNTDFCTGLGDVAHCDAAGMATITTVCPFGCNTVTGTPACNICTPNTVECQGDQLVDCDASGGVVESATDCSAFGCQTGTTPNQCNECNPGTVECQGAAVVTCNALGAVTGTTPCPYGCNGAPTPPAPDVCYACTPGVNECQGNTYVTCSAAGTIVTSTSCGTLTNQCNTGTCTMTGCAATPVADGTTCNDGLFCSVMDACTAGSCGGSARDCSDGNVCTADSCDEGVDLCINNAAVLNGSVCDDGAYCTVGETCTSGVCGGAMARNCADTNVCTVDSCSEVMDTCVHDAPAANGNTCDDGLYCTNPDSCSGGTCGGGARNCSDANACTADSCDETANVCVNNPTPLNGTACNDGLYCTDPDVCTAGSCGGGARLCADVNPCTIDSCDETGDICVHNATGANGMACDDGLFCTLGTTCTSGTCGGGMPNACSDGNQCTSDTCNEGTDLCTHANLPNGTVCDDGAFCTVSETCQTGTCMGGTPRNCNDTLLCNTDSCDEISDVCAHPCIGMTQFCSTGSNLVTCTGSGPTCGEVNIACGFSCNMTRSECNACDPADANVCTGSTAIICDTTPPGEGTITTMSTCAYGCESSVPSNVCFFPDTCSSPYVVPVSATASYGPTTFNDNMSNYGSDVAGSCGAAGDDVIHSISIPTVGGYTAFSTIVMDSTPSTGIDTASHITTVCGSAASEVKYSSAPCGAPIGAGAACSNTGGTDETLRVCGMPSNVVFPGTPPYFATLDSTVTTGAYVLSMSVTPLNLDTCMQSGNVSNTPTTPTTYSTHTDGTPVKVDNYVYDATAALGCPGGPAGNNACGVPNGDPTGNFGVCNSDGGTVGKDIVFYYYATLGGFLTVDTQGSSFDTIIYLKSGCNPNCAPPSDCLACNDDHNFTTGSWSRVYRYPVVANTLYYVVVDGYGTAEGNVQLNVAFSTI